VIEDLGWDDEGDDGSYEELCNCKCVPLVGVVGWLLGCLVGWSCLNVCVCVRLLCVWLACVCGFRSSGVGLGGLSTNDQTLLCESCALIAARLITRLFIIQVQSGLRRQDPAQQRLAAAGAYVRGNGRRRHAAALLVAACSALLCRATALITHLPPLLLHSSLPFYLNPKPTPTPTHQPQT